MENNLLKWLARILAVSLLLVSLAAIQKAHADHLPTSEVEFLEEIGKLTQVEIQQHLGDPAALRISTTKEGNNLQGWYYKYINTYADNKYYKTTELIFINGILESVTFLNTGLQKLEEDDRELSIPGGRYF